MLCVIEVRRPGVTNCVTIESFFRWDIPTVEALLGFTVVIVRRLRSGTETRRTTVMPSRQR